MRAVPIGGTYLQQILGHKSPSWTSICVAASALGVIATFATFVHFERGAKRSSENQNQGALLADQRGKRRSGAPMENAKGAHIRSGEPKLREMEFRGAAPTMAVPTTVERSSEASVRLTDETTASVVDLQPPGVGDRGDTGDPLGDLEVAMQEPHSADVHAAQVRLMAGISSTSNIRESVFDTYLDNPESPLGTMLRYVLTELADPAIEEAALETAVVGAKTHEQVAALALLRETPALSSHTRFGLLDILSDADDLVVQQMAVQALRRRGPIEVGESQTVSRGLLPYTQHDDEHMRAMSLQVLSEWSHEQVVRETLVAAVMDDESHFVRAVAARALVNQPALDAVTRNTLLELATSSSEDREVRAGAWAVLEQHPMLDTTASAHRAFTREQRMLEQSELLEALQGDATIPHAPECY